MDDPFRSSNLRSLPRHWQEAPLFLSYTLIWFCFRDSLRQFPFQRLFLFHGIQTWPANLIFRCQTSMFWSNFSPRNAKLRNTSQTTFSNHFQFSRLKIQWQHWILFECYSYIPFMVSLPNMRSTHLTVNRLYVTSHSDSGIHWNYGARLNNKQYPNFRRNDHQHIGVPSRKHDMMPQNFENLQTRQQSGLRNPDRIADLSPVSEQRWPITPNVNEGKWENSWVNE